MELLVENIWRTVLSEEKINADHTVVQIITDRINISLVEFSNCLRLPNDSIAFSFSEINSSLTSASDLSYLLIWSISPFELCSMKKCLELKMSIQIIQNNVLPASLSLKIDFYLLSPTSDDFIVSNNQVIRSIKRILKELNDFVEQSLQRKNRMYF
jgi:hypothetical protein